ncbi:MAG: chaperone protein DnaJ [Pseudomonadota bacterium]|jgi:hypothetical protein
MFERNRVDNNPTTTALPVTIAFADGAQEKGRLYVPIGRALQDCLNAPSLFLEFEPYGGERSFIAKAQIVSLKPIGVPKAPDLHARTPRSDEFDPHAALGVAPGCDWSEIRAAYVKRAKAYHPDRYSNAELPDEVRDYLYAVARRVNLAFEILEEAQQTRKEIVSHKTEAVYTSRARA